MSTVLWTNCLVEGTVTSDESDKYALYKFTKKLDKICRKLGVMEFSTTFDYTDVRFNLDQLELHPGMESTDELMAVEGEWTHANDALHMLESLLDSVQSENTKFGIIGNAHNDVVSELKESIMFAREAVEKSAKFNFAVVT